MNATEFANDIPRETAQRAYSGISFTPEKRAQQTQDDYAATLASDYQQLQKSIGPDMQATFDAEFARYREGYKARYLAYLGAKGRCVSWMIAGPSRFPVRQQEKRFNTEHKRLEELLEFRKRALDAITKTLHPELRPIMSGDGDAVERLREKIAEAETQQERMKAVNAAHKAFLKDPASLDAFDLPDKWKETIRNYKPAYSWEPHPIAPFELTNNSANIRRMKERLAGLEQLKAQPAQEAQGEKARVEDCPAENRVRLFFPGKPDEETRSRLKSGGFRWTPSLGCWQAYRHNHTIETAKREAGLTA